MQWLDKLDSVLDNVLVPRIEIKAEDQNSIDADEYYRHDDEFPFNDEFDYVNENEDAQGLSGDNIVAENGLKLDDSNGMGWEKSYERRRLLPAQGNSAMRRVHTSLGLPGVIRPVLREQSDSEDSSFDVSGDDDAGFDTDANGDDTSSNEHGGPKGIGIRDQIQTVDVSLHNSQSDFHISPLHTSRPSVFTTLSTLASNDPRTENETKNKAVPPKHAFPKPINSPSVQVPPPPPPPPPTVASVASVATPTVNKSRFPHSPPPPPPPSIYPQDENSNESSSDLDDHEGDFTDPFKIPEKKNSGTMSLQLSHSSIHDNSNSLEERNEIDNPEGELSQYQIKVHSNANVKSEEQNQDAAGVQRLDNQITLRRHETLGHTDLNHRSAFLSSSPIEEEIGPENTVIVATDVKVEEPIVVEEDQSIAKRTEAIMSDLAFELDENNSTHRSDKPAGMEPLENDTESSTVPQTSSKLPGDSNDSNFTDTVLDESKDTVSAATTMRTINIFDEVFDEVFNSPRNKESVAGKENKRGEPRIEDRKINESDDALNELEGIQATFGDFLPSGTYEEYIQDDSGSAMSSLVDLEEEDYEIEGHTSWQDDGLPPFEASMNCHGVVHVRLLRVQRLPCAWDCTLQAIFSLPPWKGRIRSPKVNSYKGPSNSGVCARWDKNRKRGKSSESDDGLEVLSIPCSSMVHAYNNEDTPVPVITIELKELALMFESKVCSLTLSCESLMKQPGVFRRQWCSANQVKSDYFRGGWKEGTEDTKAPIFLVEACFQPTGFGDSQSTGDTELLIEADRSHMVEVGADIVEKCSTINSSQGPSGLLAVAKRLKSKPHMFRNYTSLRPTYCAICASMIVWKLKGYQCEVCKLDCCADCLLRIDVEMPCGSDEAKNAVEKLSTSKLTVEKIYKLVAPTVENKIKGATENAEEGSQHDDASNMKSHGGEGVGTLTIRINMACLFNHNFPPEADLNHILNASDRWLRSGDYYARVSWTDGTDTKRTKTVFQSSKPRFDSDDISILTQHYGTEFKIEVVDATTDIAVGTKLLTTQGLLQWKRDDVGWILSPFSILDQKPLLLNKKRVYMELRSGVKTGFGLDFYNTSKVSEVSRAGEISGWVEVDVAFQENPDLYSNSRPALCPSRPEDDFNVEIIQLHIARITALFEDLKSAFDTYNYIVSWENPALTSLSLLVYVFTCLRFNTEYIGSLPVAFVIITMIHFGRTRRTNGGFRVKLVKKETEAKLKEMKGATVKYKEHRPVGDLEISVLRGKNLAHPHGIPGSLVCSILWDPLKFTEKDTRKAEIEFDPTSNILYEIGETERSSITTAPEWTTMCDSKELKRMKQLLPCQNFLSRTNSSDDLMSQISNEKNPVTENVIHFPILQPIATSGKARPGAGHDGSADDDNDGVVPLESIHTLPWEASHGAIIIQVRFIENTLHLFDQVLGDVVIPFSRIAKDGTVEGWFRVLGKGAGHAVDQANDSKEDQDISSQKQSQGIDTNGNEAKLEEKKKAADAKPVVYLKAKFNKPNNQVVTDINRESSIVVAEQFMRLAASKKEDTLGFLGTSIDTFHKVTGARGNVQLLQNQLGHVLDMTELVRNAFNFTCPEKSGMILVALCALWFVLSLIPTRFVILLGGLGNYAATFLAAFKKSTKNEITEQKEVVLNPYVTRFTNFLLGIPTNEDLRRYYFWEAAKVSEREREILAKKKRSARLTKLWKARWFGQLEVKVPLNVASGGVRQWDWKLIFCLVQGHRFIWWDSEKDFDDGENPSGQIYFVGHSGLASLSPLEMRELEKAEVPLVVNIFGRGATGNGQQTKISLLAPDLKSKEGLEQAVLSASMDKQD